MKEFEDKGGKSIYLDLQDEMSIHKCVKYVLEKEGRIDVLVNNAGFGLGGGLEDVSIEDAKKQFEVNIFGLMEITKAFIPYMRKQNSGRIINISSMAGRFSSPFLGWYHASKYALEALSDSLRLELYPFGIDVIIIEPGLIKTNWGVIAAENIRKNSGSSAYSYNANKTAKYYERNYCEKNSKASNFSVISNTILKAACVKNPKIRYSVGRNSKLFIFAKSILSDWIFDRIIYKFMEQKKLKRTNY